MAEPFKNLFNRQVINGMAAHFKKQWPKFDAKGFAAAASKDLDALELKQRSDQITNAMIQYLPADFKKAGKIMLASLGTPLDDDLSAGAVDDNGIAGWGVMPMVNYVGLHGGDHFELSMKLFKEMTKRSTSEFGIRYFLIQSPARTLAVLKKWTTDKNQHVRRLVSEGTRPRLPWAMNLSAFIEDPAPVIELLERLKDDEKEYVRRSVANNLNDIAKDHPDLVAKIATRWMKGASKERKKLVRHACRTLIKQGHQKTLKAMGYRAPEIRQASIKVLTPKVKFGSAVEFELSMRSDSARDQDLIVDYVIHHQKANGKTSPKVFKWKTTSLPAGETLNATKRHPIKKVTTRVYYPGVHTVEVMVNGVSVGSADFQLVIPKQSRK